MSSQIPPVPYFSGINFNPAFFRTIYDYLTEQIANTLYLKLRGGSLSGNLGIKKSPANVELDIAGKINLSGVGGIPANGLYGGTGTKLILQEGIASLAPPVALGTIADNLWIGAGSGNISIYTGLSEKMTIKNNGNVGIGTTDTNYKLQIRGASPNLLRVDTTANGLGQVSGIEFGTPTILNAGSAKITSTITGPEVTDLQFLTSSGLNASTIRMTIKGDGKVGIGTTDAKSLLTINTPPNLTDPLPFDYSICPLTITNTSPTGATINDPKPVLFLCRDGVSGQSYGSKASFNLCRFENAGNTNSRTRLDIGLTNTNFNDVNVMSLLSVGRVGIGTTNPTATLELKNTTYETKLNIDGYSSTYSQPLVNIIQRAGWDGNYALQVSGYTNLGGFRINGADTFNSIYQTATNTDFGFAQNPANTTGGNITFITHGAVGDLIYYTGGTNERMRIKADGKTTIGSSINILANNYINIGSTTTAPTFPITLSSTLTQVFSMPTPYALAGNANYVGSITSPVNPSIMVGILGLTAFSNGIYIYSDKRIKKDVKTIENSLDLIEKINPVSFKYIDYVEKGTINNYGVIAQEVEKIIPEVINSHKDFIPNIYKNVDSYDKDLLRLYIKTDELDIGDKIKIFDIKNKEHLKIIVDKNDDYITIDEEIKDYEDESAIFLYGKEIADVKNVNYEALFTINIKATQELYQRLRILEEVVRRLIPI